MNPKVPMRSAEAREQVWEQMLAGDGTGGEQQFTRHRCVLAGDFASSLSVKIKYALSEVVEFLTGVSQQYVTALAFEERCAKRLFERLNSLTHRSLR
jgi:hypothetical protein